MKRNSYRECSPVFRPLSYLLDFFDCQKAKPEIFEWVPQQKVKFLTIDGIILNYQLHNDNVAVLRIDARGMELDILKGGSGLFFNNPPLFIFIETSRKMDQNAKDQLYTLMIYLTNNLGYRLFESTQFESYIPYYNYSNYVQNLQKIPNICAIHNTYYEKKLEGEYK